MDKEIESGKFLFLKTRSLVKNYYLTLANRYQYVADCYMANLYCGESLHWDIR
jgi:hypothetical protein